MILKYRKIIVCIFLLLNLIQTVSGNTFVFCRNEGFDSNDNLTLYHGHNESCSEEKNIDPYAHYDNHLKDNHCNPCDDLYIENFANTSNLRKYKYVPEAMLNHFIRFVTTNAEDYSFKIFIITYNYLNTSFHFPSTTVLRI